MTYFRDENSSSIYENITDVNELESCKKLRYWMIKKNITAKKLAEMTGISQRTLERYTTAKISMGSMKAELFIKVCDTMKVDPHDLL